MEAWSQKNPWFMSSQIPDHQEMTLMQCTVDTET